MREFVAEIKKCTMTDIVDKSIVVALIMIYLIESTP